MRLKSSAIQTFLIIMLATILSQKTVLGAPKTTVNISTSGSPNYMFFEGTPYWCKVFCARVSPISVDLEYNVPKSLFLTYFERDSGIWPSSSPPPESKTFKYPVTVDSVTRIIQQYVTIKWIGNHQGQFTVLNSPSYTYDLGSKGYLEVSIQGSNSQFRAGSGGGVGVKLNLLLTPSPSTLLLDVTPQEVEVLIPPSAISDPQYRTLQVSRFGTGVLDWEIVEDCNWLEVTPTSGSSAGEVDNITLIIDPNGRTTGTFRCTLTVLAEGAHNTPITVDIILHIKAILRVPQDYNTIQAAIDDAENGDTVLVGPGTYTGDGNRNIDFKGKAITVRSENGPKHCYIEGEYGGPGFYFHSDEDSNSIVSGFTIKRCRGGVYIRGASPRISNCIITANKGVHAASGNYRGGGIYVLGVSGWGDGPTKPVIENCIIVYNVVTGGEGSNGQFSRGNAYGGGVHCSGDQVGVTIKNCVISKNKCIAGDRLLDGPPFYWVSSAYGGGIYLNGCEATISNCTITGNELYPGCDLSRGTTSYGKCKYPGEALGAGVNCYYDADVMIENSIIWDNKAYYHDSSTYKESSIHGEAVVAYSNVRDGYDGVGNVEVDPYFVEGDFQLWPESPCIDAGDPNYVGEPNETDVYGNARVEGGRVDIGAYEFAVENWMVGELEIRGPGKLAEYSSARYQAIAHYDNGKVRDVTDWAILWIEPNSCGGFDGNGLLSLERIEWLTSFRIYGEYSLDGMTTQGERTVAVGVPIRVEVFGPGVITDNFAAQYQGVVLYDDGHNQDVTDAATWMVEPNDIARIERGVVETKKVSSPEDITIYVEYTAGNVKGDGELSVEVIPARTLHVPADYEVIQWAIDDSLDGDTIVVAPGVYTGDGNRDLDFKSKAIVVRGSDPNDANVVAGTIIDCNGTRAEPHRGFKFYSGEGAYSVLAGVTITNGYAPREDIDFGEYSERTWAGGGILCVDSSPTISRCVIRNSIAVWGGGICLLESGATIKNCVITRNNVYEYGGGIYCFDGSPTIADCTVSDNVGGGIWCVSGSRPTISNCTIRDNSGSGIVGGWEANATISNCTITDNTTEYEGGGISCGDATIRNCIITGNSAEDGGGIFCWENRKQVITNCIISGNRSSREGGGICGSWGGPKETVISNCIIADNVAKYGGGVDNCWGSITNCVIKGNSAKDGGGLLRCRGPITNCIIVGNIAEDGNGGGAGSCEGLITNCTIVGNTAYERGGGLSNCSGSTTNCILWDNGPEQIYMSGLVRYSDVEGGWEGEGNIDAEPQFAFEGDYHPMPGSACIDAGTNDPCGGLAEADFEGVARPLDGDGDGNAVADMGAYEFSFESPTIAVCADSFYFVQDWPRPDAQKLSIRNCGGQPLNWEIFEECDWLEVTPANGVSIDEIDEVTIAVEANGLAPGLYSYAFKVEDVNASNSPVEILVEMPVGEVLRVPSDGLETIQDAIDAASDYDIVVVADGNYTGERNKDLDFGGKAITVKSENGPNNCVIDCENSGRGFYFQSGEKKDSVIDGFTIAKGGQGVWCKDGSPTIRNCSVIDNSGGGIVSSGPSSPRITDCTITGNTGDDPEVAGGITYGYRGPAGPATAVVTDCVISNNLGTGILCGRSTIATIENCIVSGNSSEHHESGGISSGGDMTITGCVVEGNYQGVVCGRGTKIVGCTIRDNNAVYERGGGVYCERGSLTIRECRITNNVGWKEGGGVYCEEGSVAISNSTITGNFVKGGRENYGGGIYCGDEAELAVTNCTVTGNFVDTGGGGICCRGTGACEVSNCVLWGNEASEGPEIYLRGSDAWVRYSDVEGGQDGVYIDSYSVLDWGAGNIDADPVFVEPGAGYLDDNGTPDDSRDDSYFWVEGDYHLLEGSPCIDAGDPNYAAGPNDIDLDGNPRVEDGDGDGNSVVDMGAYEVPVPPVEVAMHFTPKTLNLKSKGKWMKAHIVLPEGFGVEDVDVNTPAVIEPVGIESEYINVFVNDDGFVELEIGFSRRAFCDCGIDYGPAEITVVGKFVSGQEFIGRDTIRILANKLRGLASFASYWLQTCRRGDWCGGADVDRNLVVDFVDFALFEGCWVEVIAE